MDKKLGKAFVPPLRFIGFVFMLTGIALLLMMSFAGIILISIGLFLSFAINGVELELKDRSYCAYTSIFGNKFGKSRSLSAYLDIAVLSATRGYRVYSRGQRTLNDSEKSYDVCLLSHDHRRKLIIDRFSLKEDAIKEAKILAKQLDVKFTAYLPKLSNNSRRRRMRR